MILSRLLPLLKAYRRVRNLKPLPAFTKLPVALTFIATAFCEDKPKQKDEKHFDIFEEIQPERLDHEFLIRQATTINVNAATQLLTVTLVAIQDTSEKLRDTISKEICLVKQALEWGDGTPPQHWDQLVAIRGTLSDLDHNLRVLISYLEYAEKLATVAAEISYLSGNVAASDAICERIDHASRVRNAQKQLTHDLQQESLELQQQAIISSPQLEEKLKNQDEESKKNK